MEINLVINNKFQGIYTLNVIYDNITLRNNENYEYIEIIDGNIFSNPHEIFLNYENGILIGEDGTIIEDVFFCKKVSDRNIDDFSIYETEFNIDEDIFVVPIYGDDEEHILFHKDINVDLVRKYGKIAKLHIKNNISPMFYLSVKTDKKYGNFHIHNDNTEEEIHALFERRALYEEKIIEMLSVFFDELHCDLYHIDDRNVNIMTPNIANSHVMVIRYLIEVQNFDINTVTYYIEDQPQTGQSPLHLAVLHDKPNILEYLLNRGANPLIINQGGYTPFALAKLAHKNDVFPIFAQFDIYE